MSGDQRSQVSDLLCCFGGLLGEKKKIEGTVGWLVGEAEGEATKSILLLPSPPTFFSCVGTTTTALRAYHLPRLGNQEVLGVLNKQCHGLGREREVEGGGTRELARWSKKKKRVPCLGSWRSTLLAFGTALCTVLCVTVCSI